MTRAWFDGNEVARLTGLEPATSGVTGRHSNQLSYNRVSGWIGKLRAAVNPEISGCANFPSPGLRGVSALPENRAKGAAVER